MSLVLSHAVTIWAPHANTIRSGTNSSRISLKIINPSSERLSVLYGYDQAIIIGHHCHRRHHCHQQQNGRTISRSTFFFSVGGYFCCFAFEAKNHHPSRGTATPRMRHRLGHGKVVIIFLFMFSYLARTVGLKGEASGLGGTFWRPLKWSVRLYRSKQADRKINDLTNKHPTSCAFRTILLSSKRGMGWGWSRKGVTSNSVHTCVCVALFVPLWMHELRLGAASRTKGLVCIRSNCSHLPFQLTDSPVLRTWPPSSSIPFPTLSTTMNCSLPC